MCWSLGGAVFILPPEVTKYRKIRKIMISSDLFGLPWQHEIHENNGDLSSDYQ